MSGSWRGSQAGAACEGMMNQTHSQLLKTPLKARCPGSCEGVTGSCLLSVPWFLGNSYTHTVSVILLTHRTLALTMIM